MVNKKQIKEKLQEVKDPEIPTLSVLELGIITKIEIPEPNFVAIEMTPTFVGCPAIDFMRIKVQKAVESLDVKKVEVVVNYDKSWSSNLITEEGKKKLLEFGIAPPRKHKGEMESEDLEKAECPH
ncbi:MAG: 1,2-phenylacetyl-CoA epoxidase subunit PaaD, partial [Chitinophagales bacterium]